MMKFFALASAVVLGGVVLAAADWPQWQGPDRTRMSKETGLLKEWPAGGPRVIWTANNLGTGYGSMSVAGDRVYLQGARGRSSVVIALNRADGKEVWAKPLGPIETRMRTNMGAGPRGTPTVDGDRLYVLTENGDLACLKTDGSPVWQTEHPQGVRRLAAAMDDQRVAARRRTARRGVSRRSGRGHREAGQDDGQDRLDVQGAERHRRLFVDHRRGRAGRAHVHDLHRTRRRRRPGVGRQTDVPVREGREQRGQHRDAGLLQQQGVLLVRRTAPAAGCSI